MSFAVLRKAGLLAAFAGWVYAQSVSSLVENRNQVHTAASKWIVDVDPKQRAWAAELIAQYQLEDLYPELIRQLERFQARVRESLNGPQMNLHERRPPTLLSGYSFEYRHAALISFTPHFQHSQ